jgi:gluconokinase
MICIIMGVAGSGKSTIGTLLSRQTGWQFYDGDDFQPPENVQKMSLGIPLTDGDRQSWLLALRALIDEKIANKSNVIIACSALKASYRELLQGKNRDIAWIYLKGDRELLTKRLQQRQNHFMKAEMLASQLGVFEEPNNAAIVSIEQTPQEIATQILDYLQLN